MDIFEEIQKLLNSKEVRNLSKEEYKELLRYLQDEISSGFECLEIDEH